MKRFFYFQAQRVGVLFLLQLAVLFNISGTQLANAQGLHFSQFYNAPLLTSPANTGLMSDRDYRIGADYRTQWGAVPVPFKSSSIYGDVKVLRNENQTSWLGFGAAVFSDNAGDGNLSMTRVEGFGAYHLLLSEQQMISFGASVAYVQRSVDFTKLSFDAQWDGFDFNTSMPNNEMGTMSKASYADISAGINYAIYPKEYMYLKIGAALAHINQPRESFLNQSNQVGMRPTLNAEALIKTSKNLIVNPSVYYTSQRGAKELMYGSLIIGNMNEGIPDMRLILGAYHRWNDALVGVFGIEWRDLRIVASYDYTISGLGQYISHNGATEIGLRWKGLYKKNKAQAQDKSKNKGRNAKKRQLYERPQF